MRLYDQTYAESGPDSRKGSPARSLALRSGYDVFIPHRFAFHGTPVEEAFGTTFP